MGNETSEEERLERLNFHLETGDYFPLLATILGFAQETMQGCTCSVETEITPIETHVLKDTRSDLMYLHKNYRIVRLSEEDVIEE